MSRSKTSPFTKIIPIGFGEVPGREMPERSECSKCPWDEHQHRKHWIADNHSFTPKISEPICTPVKINHDLTDTEILLIAINGMTELLDHPKP